MAARLPAHGHLDKTSRMAHRGWSTIRLHILTFAFVTLIQPHLSTQLSIMSRTHFRPSRRTFLASTVCAGASTSLAYVSAGSKNDRPVLGLIGAGFQPTTKRQGRGIAIGKQAAQFGDLAMLCELDDEAADYAMKHVMQGQGKRVSDYREVLNHPEIDAVLIATPDHWHAKIAIEAMRAGKDVYCEKPVAVTIDEGKRIREVVKETSQVFQVGTQQRSEYANRFLTAVALVRHGRIGTVKQIRVGLGPGWEGGPFETQPPPKTLDWEKWLGPAPMTEYIPERTHRTFRWWYEYAGGQLCDWGAHHVDIAQWAIGQTDRSAKTVSGTAKLNQPLRNGMPTRSDTYNTPIEYSVKCQFDDGIEMLIDTSRNGITFTGTKGRFFVNRGTLEGTPVSQLKEDPLPDDAIATIYNGSAPGSHMGNFFECLKTRKTPISDIDSHHRILTTCHLANICLRMNRTITWDSSAEQIVGDDAADALQVRTYRKGYEIDG